MTDPQQRREAIAAANRVADSVDKLGPRVDDLNKRMGMSEADRRTLHRSTRWNFVLAAVAVALAGWLLFQQFTVNGNRASVTALHSSQVSVCQQSNTRLAEQNAVWAYLLAKATVPKNATAKERALVEREYAHLRVLIHDAFAARDCARLYRN